MGWYLAITREMREAGLSGNGLLIYALVFGYSQAEQGCYYGSLAHTAEVVGCTAETARTTLRSLLDAGLLDRFEFIDNGIHRVAYRATQKIWDTQKIWEGHPKNLGTTTQKIWDNNTTDNSNDNKTCSIKRFAPPTFEQVADYCAKRGNGIDPQAFIDHYTSNGWKVGNAPMKDWQAAVRTWEQRRKEQPREYRRTSYQQPQRLSPEERTMAALARLQARDGSIQTFSPDEQ